jgi:signal transduction histidine kinase
MADTNQVDAQLAGLASVLAERQPAILQAWRDAVEADPQLTTASALPRKQLSDHIPDVLNAFCRTLRERGTTDRVVESQESKEDASAHGLHRWQQGYQLREVAREWAHLQLCIANELKRYASTQPELEPEVMPMAYHSLAWTCGEGVSESTNRYFELQQIEAAGFVKDLQQTLEEVKELERQRTDLWREAAHDLRGNLGVVANVTTGLRLKNIPEPVRDKFLGLLQKNVTSLHGMLDEVMSLARLQAGQEQRAITTIDASALLCQLCENLKPLAEPRGLFLKLDGPPAYAVEGDAIKLQRIVQNLLINAFKYTGHGGVTITWGDSRPDDTERWMLCVEDTGPGIHAGPGAPIAEALEEATHNACDVEKTGENNDQPDGGKSTQSRAEVVDPRPVNQERGEGIGLAIVKRLSELLDATVEMTSQPNRGTTVRIILPRRYPR